LLLGLALLAPLPGFLVHDRQVREEEKGTLGEVEDALAERSQALRERLLGLSEAAHAIRGLYHSSREVTRAEFAIFTGEMRRRMPAILAVEWIPRIMAAERAAHEASTRAEGFDGYTITETGPERHLVATSERECYFPVSFVEPLFGNESALGFDLGSEATRRRALALAARSDDLVLSDPVSLVQGVEAGPGLLAFLSVRSPAGEGGPKAGGELQGFIVLVFPVAALVDWAWPGARGPEGLELRLELSDMDMDGKPSPLWETPSTGPLSERIGPDAVQLISFGQQEWTVRGSPLAAFASRRTGGTKALGIAVSVIWALLFGSLLLLTLFARGRDQRRQSAVVRSVLGNMDDGVMVADTSGNILFANAAATAIVDWSDPAAARSGPKAGTTTPDGTEPLPPGIVQLSRAASGERCELEQVRLPGGSERGGRWLSVRGGPVRGERGDLLGGVVVLREITQQKNADETVRRLSSAVEQTADMVMITGRDGEIEYVNPAFEATFGYSRSDSVGQSPRILRSGQHDRAYYQKLWATILEGKVYRAQTVNRKKSGELIHVEQTITPMKDEHGELTHFVSVFKDSTERIRNEERENELRAAAHVQMRLFPKVAPRLHALDLAGRAIPAVETSGDYFDFIPLKGGNWAVTIGDVSGHGLGAALIMAEVRAYIRSLLQVTGEPDLVLDLLNRSLCEDVDVGTFVTLFVVILDPKTRSVRYASAGHQPALLLRTTGDRTEELGPTGPGIGIFPDAGFRSSPWISMEPGDVLALLTDGITESRSTAGSFFGDEGVIEILRSQRHSSAEDIVDVLCLTARRYCEPEPVQDDITTVVIKAVG
jgi:PAS domain S-box-containing protein